ncbi:hypothetical protein ACHAW5_008691 [Stephanodiscus triporus]|uniref:LysM domain-containing protein n=1 Tax=Stephanodiscus triporus TaxID=2934178 RepID=A0ABD3NZS6_9STRA
MYNRALPPPRQPGTYAGLSKPLPDPPKGQVWAQDASSREWKLVPTTTHQIIIDVDDAPPSPPPLCHAVLPTDTFGGICLRYGVTPIALRRANKMLGDDLKLAPDVLVIPSNEKSARPEARGKSQTKEQKVASLVFRAKLTTKVELAKSEARAYLEIAGWDANAAIEAVEADIARSAEETRSS